MSYLVDTNIIIFFFKGKYQIQNKIATVGIQNCFISEITLAELRFGAYNSSAVEKHLKEVDELLNWINVLPIFPAISTYGEEKARLRKAGTIIDDFDLLIGVTAIENNHIMVTNNTKHFSRIKGIQLEDWIK